VCFFIAIKKMRRSESLPTAFFDNTNANRGHTKATLADYYASLDMCTVKFLFVLALVVLGVFVPQVEAKGGQGGGCPVDPNPGCYARADLIINYCNSPNDSFATTMGWTPAKWNGKCKALMQESCTHLASGAGGNGAIGSG
jgi:hypothetical protein